MTSYRRVLLFSLGLFITVPCGLQGQSTAAPTPADAAIGAQVGFRYENAQLQPAKYVLLIHENGSGSYSSEPGATPPADTPSYHPLAQAQERSIKLSQPVVEQIFGTAREEKFFAVPCEDKKGKIAFQGTKELSYQGPEGKGACTYNWSKLPSIQKLTTVFESIAFTLEEGRRLELEHKHDHLAVDEELGELLNAVKDGRALEIQNIQPTLQAIIDDEAMLERARNRARKLLEGTGAAAF